MIHHITLSYVALIAVTWPAGVQGQRAQPRGPEPQVPIVQTLGCVEARNGSTTTWWLTRAAEPTVTNDDVFNENEVEAARSSALGSGEFQLIGVADFLDAASLLRFGDRAEFTTDDQVNATNQLRQGGTALVKGLLIADDARQDASARINLLMVVALADGCG